MPRDDNVHLAEGFMWMAALFILVPGICVTGLILWGVTEYRALPSWQGIVVPAAFMLPGAAFVASALGLRHRRRWAAISGIILTSLVLGIVVAVAIITVAQTARRAGESSPLPFLAVMLAICYVLGHVLLTLIRAARELHPAPDPKHRGFEPLMHAAPAKPAPPPAPDREHQ